MTTPSIRGNNNQSSRSKDPDKVNVLPLVPRRFAAWAIEMTLVAASGLVPFGLGVYANSRTELNRVPLNPILVTTERAIARPLALPVSYGNPNVAWPTNILWTVALLAPISLSWWQLYLLGKTGSTIPKRWLGVRVVNEEGKAPGLGAVVVREGLGRWSVPLSIAYLLWRYSFAFPNLGLFTSLAVLMVIGEALGWPTQKRRRAFHDVIAGTYAVDAKVGRQVKKPAGSEGESTTGQPTTTAVSRRNPNLTLLLVGLASMIAVLSTLVSTQIYIQSQESSRRNQQVNSQKFLELVKQVNSNPGMSIEERQKLYLAMGGLNDQQAIKFLVDLLTKETEPTTIETVQQALVKSGPAAIEELKRMNQFLIGELNAVGNNPSREFRQRQLIFNQQVINKILAVNSGKIKDLDLSKAQLGNSSGESSAFSIVLDNTDLSGVIFKSANLNQGSFKGARFRGIGEDGRWDTYDDAIADLSQAQLKQVNFTDANLSRVPLNRSDLSRSILNRANLSSARLIGANLSSSQLVSTDLRNAVLENALLTGADLTDAKLIEADLYAARLVRVSAVGTQLFNANLTKTDWQAADLSEAYLDHANLSGANLSAARLSGAVLRSANLENASLRNTDLTRADLREANLAGADLQGAVLFPPKQDPTDQFVQTPDLGSQAAIVKGVDFNDAKNLDAKQLAFICTQGGVHSRCP
ncbi:MAG TPA: pentapeptide repeat-containing protein [Nostocaceae cyanobacterium]|nr:pentapeptide repeat-containing protein [Nostocaceae cyanobacterium]